MPHSWWRLHFDGKAEREKGLGPVELWVMTFYDRPERQSGAGGRVWWKMPQRLELDGYNAPKLKAYIQTNVLIRQTKRSQSVVTYACNSAHVPPSLSKGARIPGKTWATQIESGKKESEAGKLVILWLREECPNRHEPAKKNNKRFPPTPFSHLQTHTSNYTLPASNF